MIVVGWGCERGSTFNGESFPREEIVVNKNTRAQKLWPDKQTICPLQSNFVGSKVS